MTHAPAYIRAACKDDIPTLLAFGRAMIAEAANDQHALDERYFTHILTQMIANPDYLLLVRECDNDVCGAILGRLSREFHNPGVFLHVIHFYIVPGARNMRVAQSMVKTLIEVAKEYVAPGRLSHIEMCTTQAKVSAADARLWETLGFTITGFTLWAAATPSAPAQQAPKA
jgi:hypothetical protein